MNNYQSLSRARQLLNDWLTDEQRKLYDKHDVIWVRPSAYRNSWFMLHDGWQVHEYNVRRSKGVHTEWPVLEHVYCIGVVDPNSDYYLPLEDSLLTQMLLLQTDTALFRRIACQDAYGFANDYGSFLSRTCPGIGR